MVKVVGSNPTSAPIAVLFIDLLIALHSGMWNSKTQSAGGKARGDLQRKEAIESYYLSPNICEHCNSIINVSENEKVADVKKKKFCNHSCAAIFNNKSKQKESSKFTKIKITNCTNCNILVELKRHKNGSYTKRKFCNDCLKFKRNGRSLEDMFESQTKGSLYKRRKNWQSANSGLRKHARQVYFSSDAPKHCKECGYDKHIEVCHIKQVKEFDDDVSVVVINELNNLVALCPTHHWEFDNLK